MLDVFDGILAARLCGTGGASPTPPAPVLIEKTVTANGVYNAEDDHADGYSSVTVNTPQLPVTFLKSIKSVGNSIILTDIVPNYNWDVFFDLMIENPKYNSGNDIFFGTRKAVETSEHFLMAFGFAQNWSAYTAWSGFSPTNQDSIYVSNIDNAIGKRQCCIMRRGNAKCIFGDKSFTMTTRTTDDTPSTPIGIAGFDCDDPNEYGILPYSRSDITIYGITLLDENGAVIHNLIPAKAKSNGRAGLYDVITGTFYPSDPEHDDFIKEEIINE